MLTILYNKSHDNSVTEEYIKALLVMMFIKGYGTSILTTSRAPNEGNNPSIHEAFKKLLSYFYLTTFFTFIMDI